MGLAHVRAGVTLRMRWWPALLVLLLQPLFTAFAAAHDLPYSYADLRFQRGHVELTLALHRDDAAALLGEAAPASPAPLITGAPDDPRVLRLANAVASRLRLIEGKTALALRFQNVAAHPAKKQLALSFTARPRSRAIQVEWSLFPAGAQHETFLKVYVDGGLTSQDVLAAGHPIVVVDRGASISAIAAFTRYVAAGIHHIAIGPDHVLFIAGLVLLGGGLGRILSVVTAFTAAHSLTLALAVLGVVHPPSALVEPAIALSIVYVGLDNLRALRGARDWRTPIAFGFGLVHGFGFASVLRDVGLPREAVAGSLLGFNVGVEVGQVTVVLLVAPGLALLGRHSPPLARRVAWAGSLAILLVGGLWFLERVTMGA